MICFCSAYCVNCVVEVGLWALEDAAFGFCYGFDDLRAIAAYLRTKKSRARAEEQEQLGGDDLQSWQARQKYEVSHRFANDENSDFTSLVIIQFLSTKFQLWYRSALYLIDETDLREIRIMITISANPLHLIGTSGELL